MSYVGTCSSARVDLRRAVVAQLDEADREELHDLARVVLVGEDLDAVPLLVVRVRLVAPVREVAPHQRVVRHLAQHVAERAERVADENVVVVRPDLLLVPPRLGALLAEHEDLRERPRDALPQLVVRLERDVRPRSRLAVARPVLDVGLRRELARVSRSATASTYRWPSAGSFATSPGEPHASNAAARRAPDAPQARRERRALRAASRSAKSSSSPSRPTYVSRLL